MPVCPEFLSRKTSRDAQRTQILVAILTGPRRDSLGSLTESGRDLDGTLTRIWNAVADGYKLILPNVLSLREGIVGG